MSRNTPESTPKSPMNVMAVVGFVLSILGFNVIAIILGAVALSQIRKRDERGRGFALAAIWIGVISLIMLVVFGSLWRLFGHSVGVTV